MASLPNMFIAKVQLFYIYINDTVVYNALYQFPPQAGWLKGLIASNLDELFQAYVAFYALCHIHSGSGTTNTFTITIANIYISLGLY